MRNSIEVVKFGTELTKNGEGINHEAIGQYAEGLTTDQRYDGLVVVTSGAVAAGRHIAMEFGKENLNDQVLSGLGQAALFSAWIEAFRGVGRLAGSESITHSQLDGENSRQALTHWVQSNIDNGIVTILNEADAVSETELMALKTGGDNDGLAEHVARILHADSLTLFTKKGGVYDDKGELIPFVSQDSITEIFDMIRARKVDPSKQSRGGIVSKVEAAWRFAMDGGNATISAISKDTKKHNATTFAVER